MIELLFKNQIYLFYLLGIMIISGIIKERGYFSNLFNYIVNKVKFKKAVVALISLFSGILPIPGRVIVSAGILDTVAPKSGKSRSKFGIIDYLATHHYYLWSPLEKTIILPIATLNLTYFEVIEHIAPLLLITLLYITYYIVFILKENDIKIQRDNLLKKNEVPVNIKKYINWNLLLTVFVVIVLSNIISTYHDYFIGYISYYQNLFIVSCLGFLISIALGSSGKFIGITVLLTQLFGIEYFTLFFAVEYAGYLISPVHKCVAIGKMYFGTPIIEYMKVLGGWSILIILFGGLTLL
jgi:hypothetical protein